MRSAKLFQTIIGDQFDHVSFDPRGQSHIKRTNGLFSYVS